MNKTPDFGAVHTSAELLTIVRLMEEGAAERYRELAEAFETSCNLDTAAAFRELAEGEDRHAAEFPALAGPAPRVTPWGEEDPEIADPDAVHYLMHPWHVFELALRNEEKTLSFFEALAVQSPHAEVKAEAVRLAERERGHVDHVKRRMAELPVPPDDWDEDDDPPNWEAGD
ncbi:MAG: ferritin family protein [Phaeospirillum sp.]|nr:ferritin family protein [Phaeospirillum sp.]